MSDTTSIEWATATWNPWEGCTMISEGCAHCYAAARNHRFGMDNWGKDKPRRRTSAANWKKPLAWEREERESKDSCGIQRPRIFPSLCDWLDDEVPIEWLADFLKLIHDTPNLDWLLLTKRPENFVSRLAAVTREQPASDAGLLAHFWLNGEPPANVWPGASVENQRCADERIPELLKIPAGVRFLSVEPLLEEVDLRIAAFNGADSLSSLEGIHWVIVGGESGLGARPCSVEWVRSIVIQCKAAGVPCFVKQLGAKPYEEEFHHTSDCWNDHCALAGGPEDCAGHVGCEEWTLKHPKGGDPAEWTTDLRVREFPKA